MILYFPNEIRQGPIYSQPDKSRVNNKNWNQWISQRDLDWKVFFKLISTKTKTTEDPDDAPPQAKHKYCIVNIVWTNK